MNPLAMMANPQAAHAPQMRPQMPQQNAFARTQQKTMAEQVSKSTQGQKFNGDVKFQGKTIPVRDGVATYNGEKYYVFGNENLVMNEGRQLIAKIVGNNVEPIDAQHAEALRQAGIIE